MLSAPSTSFPLGPGSSGQAWFWGHNERQRHLIKRWLLSLMVYGVVDALLAVGVRWGLVPSWQWALQAIYHAMGLSLFYMALRRPVDPLRRQPSLAYEQVIFSISAVALAYALTPLARGAALQLLCLALVLDMQRLDSRQMRQAAWTAMTMLSVALLAAWLIDPSTIAGRRELLSVLLASIQLPILFLLAREVRQLRKRQIEQRVELQETLEQLENLSNHDSLTGLVTRQYMQRLLDAEVKRQRRSERAFCLAIVDIDQFKRINDQHGHAVGDAVLRDFANLARTVMSPADVLSRWSGEEFILLMPESTMAQAMTTLTHIRRRMEEHDWSHYSADLAARFSAGMTEHVATDTLEATFERADKALQLAKGRAGGQIVPLGVSP